MRYLSVCSGIEAATVAWHDLGWKAAAYSEIEKFPCEVLKHLYPNVPNVGDMTKFEEWKIGTIDLLVGGTPCQSFSVAGLRKGLDDPRGNLMLTYGAIAKRFRPKWLVWENVPGVLSSNGGRDFGTFLGMLGELGYGFAYRVLDAQYFGVAQRRRRVFVVGCLGDWRRAAAVLFERDSLCGNPAPSREARKGTAPSAQPSPAYGGSNSECADTVTSKWAKGSGGPSGNEGGLFVAQPVDVPEVMSTLLSSTAGVSRPGNAATEHETYIPMAFDTRNGMAPHGSMVGDIISPTLRAKEAEPPMITQPRPFRKSKRAQTADDDEFWVDDGVANTINLFDQGDVRTTHAVVQPIAWDEELNATIDMAGTLLRGGQGGRRDGVMAFSSNMSVPDCQTDVSPTLKLGGQGGNPPAIAFNGDQSEKTRSIGESSDHTPTLRADGPCHVATMRESGQGYWVEDDKAGTLRAEGENRPSRPSNVINQSMAVRRLTPRECERLQGFPDDYTRIPWRKGETPDGPRYKALGNSMAVPVMAWIGQRINLINDL